MKKARLGKIQATIQKGAKLLPVAAVAAGALAGAAVYATAPALACGAARRAKTAPFAGRNYAHRGLFGAGQTPPENSLPAFVAAAQNGYGIELDVQFTRDEQLVVFHDDTLDRMTSASGFVHNTPWSEVQTLRLAGSGDCVPLFKAVLGAVAAANATTPLIVEIKSRREYQKPYLRRLVRATLAALETYPGPYCIESFDPRVVGLTRQLAPWVLRGQLADSYLANRKAGAEPAAAYFASHLLGNCYGRPEFVAWCPARPNWAVRLCHRLGAMKVMWTALPEDDAGALERENDAVIFQWYSPAARYGQRTAKK